VSRPQPGDALAPLERTIGLPDMVAYAGATWDWHRVHYDPAEVAARGLPGPLVDGQVFGALLVEALQDWLGPRAVVERLEMRFARPVFAGETVRCEGEVTAQDEDRIEVDLRVVVVGEDGGAARTAVAPATARVGWRS
jgi:acyl dehydratase